MGPLDFLLFAFDKTGLAEAPVCAFMFGFLRSFSMAVLFLCYVNFHRAVGKQWAFIIQLPY